MKKGFLICMVITIVLINGDKLALSKEDNDISDNTIINAEKLEHTFKNRDENKGSKKLIKWMKTQMHSYGIKNNKIKIQKFKNFHTGFNEKYNGENLVVELPGKSDKKQIIVGGHYDGTGYGDNGSGVAFILSLIKDLSKEELPYTIKFVFFDKEEKGLIGSQYFVKKMSFKEKNKTLMMINIDSIAFGDYPMIYGGVYDDKKNTVKQTEVYKFAVKTAKDNNIGIYTTQDLDGYYRKNHKGPSIKRNTLYSNPWTQKNPAPNQEMNHQNPVSPTSGMWGDHKSFADKGIPYLHLEATNWFTYDKDNQLDGYDGYIDTNNYNVGSKGRFMNSKFDNSYNMHKYFPKRLENHATIYGVLIKDMLKEPNANFKREVHYTPYLGTTAFLIIVILLGFFWKLKKRKID